MASRRRSCVALERIGVTRNPADMYERRKSVLWGIIWLGHLSWIDSLLNPSMILGEMAPADPLKSGAAKIFASCYALFSGLAFIGIVSVLLAPFVHRMLRRFHAEERE
jgi:hypothetical protein